MNSKAPLVAIALFCLSVSPGFALSEFPERMGVRDPFTELVVLSGESAQAVEHAMPIFRKKMNWKSYKVAVMESETFFLVEFWQPERETKAPALAVFEDNRFVTNDEVSGGLQVTMRNGSFQVKLNKKTWRQTWNSVDGYN